MKGQGGHLYYTNKIPNHEKVPIRVVWYDDGKYHVRNRRHQMQPNGEDERVATPGVMACVEEDEPILCSKDQP